MKTGSLFFSLLCIFMLLSESIGATEWRTNSAENSSISFVAAYDEVPFTGTFSNFRAVIQFDESFTNSFIYAEVDMTSFNTRSRDRDEALVEPDWFATSQFAKAYFRSTSIRQENGQFHAQGIISIKDLEQSISFPFEWDVSDSAAKFKATFALDRRTFRIGDGVWMGDPTIGYDVEVRVDLALEKTETED